MERINSRIPTWEILGFIDDDKKLWGSSLDGRPVLGGCAYLAGLDREYYVLCAVGSPGVRREIIERVRSFPGIHFATVIDPDVKMSSYTLIGKGTIVCAGTIMTVGIRIGNYNIINLDCTVGHDVETGDFVTLYPSVNLSGNVSIGADTEIGTGAQVIQGRCVGNGTVIGAGAVVVEDIGNHVTAVGVPARAIHREGIGRIKEDCRTERRA